jgi:cytochrome c553
MIVSLALMVIAVLSAGCLTQTRLATQSEVQAQNSNEPGPVGDPIRGERIALSCARCHGDAGMSDAAWIPSLAGMNRDAIYKQLDDYRSHRRRPEWYMASVAEALSLQDSADVSAYYASQTHGFASRAPGGDSPSGTASCGTCHDGQSKDTPQITGQQPQYLEIQMSLFAQKIRTNDRDGVMQKIAGQLTPDEIQRISESLGGKSR